MMASLQWFIKAYNFAATNAQFHPHRNTTNGYQISNKKVREIPFDNIKDMEFLDRGSQGTVYTAKYCNERVAVKRLNNHRMLAQISHLSKLNHRNVIKFIGISRKNLKNSSDKNSKNLQYESNKETLFIVMEFCPFGSLYDLVRCGRQIPPSKVADWAHQIAEGMNYLHTQHNIIHCDLKSPNILLSNHDTLKISDFESKRILANPIQKDLKSSTNDLLNAQLDSFRNDFDMTERGTIPWMAPEMILNKQPYTFGVDIWSYGVVVWELLTCEIPFKTISKTKIIFGLGIGQLRPTVSASFPEGYKRLLRSCWRFRADQRPTFQQILVELRSANDELMDISIGLYRQLQLSWKQDIDINLKAMNCLIGHAINSKDSDQDLEMDTLETLPVTFNPDYEFFNCQRARKIQNCKIQNCKRQDQLVLKMSTEDDESIEQAKIDYEQKLRFVLDSYMELQACWLQINRYKEELSLKEKELNKREAELDNSKLDATVENFNADNFNSTDRITNINGIISHNKVITTTTTNDVIITKQTIANGSGVAQCSNSFIK